MAGSCRGALVVSVGGGLARDPSLKLAENSLHSIGGLVIFPEYDLNRLPLYS